MTTTRKKKSKRDNPEKKLTLGQHIQELQSRLFAVVGAFLVVGCITYPFFDAIVNVLLAPLGDKHELVYLTPGGAFGFIIKVCLYVAAIGTLPVFIYHLYRFLMPAVRAVSLRKVLGYTLLSFVLACVGIAFAYFISLPAALYFLTGFELHHINPMLTVDSYLSFVMTYLLAGALLFQLPIVVMIINSVTPLSPGGMMKFQKYIIVGSFIFAAVISPTPDAVNQTILALPLIVMYQFSVIAIWTQSRKAKKKQSQKVHAHQPVEATVVKKEPTIEAKPAMPQRTPVVSCQKNITTSNHAVRTARSIDGMYRRSPRTAATRVTVPQRVMSKSRYLQPESNSERTKVRPRQTIDGFFVAQ